MIFIFLRDFKMKLIMPINQSPFIGAAQRYYILTITTNGKRRKKFHNPDFTAKKRQLYHYINEKIVTLQVGYSRD